ncbi:MAG TPA: protein kinase [Vicinamibacterales bacterium]|nr:protein kinase [Vicinamibacterales bacterium]
MSLTPSCSRCGTPLSDPDQTGSCPACLLALGLDADVTKPGVGHPLDPIHDYLPDLPPHYQLETRVGTGGMGIVYRALDTRLNRPVAVKVVQEARLTDPGAGARFRAEALAAASLDHPFICKVYELIESEGKALLVMEFVEGETLAGMLRQGRPQLARTVELVAEIAEGLANAHSVGLVHRDIKPSNVMVTPHGHVKLLDFGLARAEVVSEAGATTRSPGPDGDPRAGTPHYMPPEQAEGQPIAARADIFSLGVVAFECIAGELPFNGATEYTYVHSMLHDAPKPLGQLAPGTPKELVRLIERCLAKDPAHRPKSAAAVAKELRQIAKTSVASTTHTLRAASLRRSRNWWARTAIASLVVTASIALAIGLWRPPPGADVEFQQQALVTWPTEEERSASSPDGRWVSFLSKRDDAKVLFVQPTDGGDAKLVALPAGEIISHAWSADGTRYVCAMRLRAALFLLAIPAPLGGAPVQSVEIPPAAGITLLRWLGDSVYFQADKGNAAVLRRADLAQRTVAEVSDTWRFAEAPLQSAVFRSFDIDPTGSKVVFAARLRSGERTDLWTANVHGTNPRRLTSDAHVERLPMWTGPETVLYQSDRGGQVDLWESSVAHGWTRRRTTDPTQEEPESASSDGMVMTFRQVSDNADLWLLDRARPAVQLTSEATTDFSPTVSTDGHTLVFQRSKPSASGRFVATNTWLMRATLTGGRVSIDPLPIETDASAPLISPDGRRVAFLQETQGDPALKTLKIRHLQTGVVVTVSSRCILPVYGRIQWGAWPTQWTPDGQTLLFVEKKDERSYSLTQHAVDSETNIRLIDVATDPQRIRGLFPAADSRSVAYLHWAGEERYAVRQTELDSRKSVELARVDGAPGLPLQSVSIAGRTAQGSLIVLRWLSASRTGVEVLEVKPNGHIRSIRTVPNIVDLTSYVDVRRPLLYVICVSGLIQNVFSVSLETGAMRQVTGNQAPNVSFSGVASLVDGSLLFVRNLGTRDIWLLKRSR